MTKKNITLIALVVLILTLSVPAFAYQDVENTDNGNCDYWEIWYDYAEPRGLIGDHSGGQVGNVIAGHIGALKEYNDCR